MQKSAEHSSRSQLVRVLARLLTAHPSWVLAHAQGYVDLGLEQAQLASAAWQRRVALLLLAAGSGGLGLIFVGVGVMLWAVSPDLPAPRVWVLALVPLLPLLGAGVLVLLARAVERPPGLLGLKQQWNADLAMLREVSTHVAPPETPSTASTTAASTEPSTAAPSPPHSTREAPPFAPTP